MRNQQIRLEVWMAAALLVLGLVLWLSETRAALASGAAAAPTDVLRYRLDADKSTFTVRALVGGLLSAFGHNHTIAVREFTGEATVTPGAFAPASLNMTIKAGSLAVTDKVSDSDRNKIETTMRQEVLATGQHPEITFRSTRAEASRTGEGSYQAKIFGELTLRGVTRETVINAQVTFDSDTMRARGAFALKQSAYGIKPPSVLGGTVKVKDELKLSFDILGRKQ